MFKKTLIILLSSFIGITASPDFLIASDEVAVNGLNNDKIVQTVIEKPKPVEQPVVQAAPVVVAKAKPAAKTTPVQTNHLDIAGRSLKVEYTPDTAVNAGNVVKFFNNKFLYGHNSGNVFGFLPTVNVGQTFSLTYNGVTTNYKVMEKVVYEKASDTTLRLNGKEINMSFVANGKKKYNLTLMTCSGQSYGNGDASHRLVLYANAI